MELERKYKVDIKEDLVLNWTELQLSSNEWILWWID